ncbi:MAG TPA: DUF6094 domain-containing protein [Thermoanaerobaculia bacterium]|nr:DUF6094 domain-containing protein [Thermoanaerobaculia bacterium]
MRWPEPQNRTYLIDPCAGEGVAIETLRRLWVESYCPHSGAPAGPWPIRMSVRACELEAERALALRRRLPFNVDDAFHGDAFQLCSTGAEDSGATVLYLNPPYDHDPEHGRLEHRFLLRFTQHLHPGSGFLFFLVPHYALEASADFLARQYLDLRAWRLPEPEFQAFRQVLLVGRRAAKPLSSAPFAETLRMWARDAETLPVLPEQCPDPYVVDTEAYYYLDYTLAPFDLTAAVEAFRPWQDCPVGTSVSARQLLGARYETAMPPKPVHIALALSAGMFNGHRLEPNDPWRHPPLLAKGVFERDLVPISERFNREGELVATVEIERPTLCLTLLRLDDYTFHQLEPGTIPNGGDDVSRWNAADLIRNYDRSLARLLREQFPALHDPHRSDHQIALPELARKPFRAQAQAVQAALKLLSRGFNPFLVAEVGTGKSTMALTIAAALSPEHHEATTAAIRRLGLTGRLPRVQKTLIVCPPHLLKSWSDQAAAVLPDFNVQIVENALDLTRPARIYILSRETAKLGHGHRGIEGRCPRCGSPVETSPATNVSRRLRCGAILRRPKNRTAHLALTLAALLGPAHPKNPLVAELVTSPALRRRIASLRDEGVTRPVDEARLLDFHDAVLREIGSLFRAGDGEDHLALLTLSDLLVPLHRALGTGERDLPGLRALLEGRDPRALGPVSWIRSAIGNLEAHVTAEENLDLEEERRHYRATAFVRVLESLHARSLWEEMPPCGEPLFQAIPEPRRYPLAQLIVRRHSRDFDLLILDEAHEMNNSGSAQAKAAHRLSGLPGVPTIALTGSLMGGYASSLFANFWALSPTFRSEFGRDDRAAFIARYGFRKVLVSRDGSSAPRELGSHTDREIGQPTTIGEAPGLMPTFILRHLLPVAALVHKDDLDVELPALTESPAPIAAPDGDPLAGELIAEYERLQDALLDRIRADRFDKDRAGRLLGALVELPSYLDRASDDQAPFEIRYPAALGGELIETATSFPASWRTPKETWLLSRVASFLRRGDKVLVFLRHTGTSELPARLLRLLKEVTPRVAWLDAKKVPTQRREDWIDQNVLAKDVQVLLVNPNAVRTGLNNLVSFSAGLWYELDLSTTTYRQANGRLHRIGQTRPVTIETAFYADTAQEVTFDLIAKKTTASLQVDGLDLQAALEAAGASSEETAALGTALSLGQAVYRALAGRR